VRREDDINVIALSSKQRNKNRRPCKFSKLCYIVNLEKTHFNTLFDIFNEFQEYGLSVHIINSRLIKLLHIFVLHCVNAELINHMIRLGVHKDINIKCYDSKENRLELEKNNYVI